MLDINPPAHILVHNPIQPIQFCDSFLSVKVQIVYPICMNSKSGVLTSLVECPAVTLFQHVTCLAMCQKTLNVDTCNMFEIDTCFVLRQKVLMITHLKVTTMKYLVLVHTSVFKHFTLPTCDIFKKFYSWMFKN